MSDNRIGRLRSLGYIIDLGPAMAVSFAFYVAPAAPQWIGGIVLLLWWLLRDVTGASLGKRVLQLRVVSSNGGPAAVFQRVLRNLTLIAAPVFTIVKPEGSITPYLSAGLLLVEAILLLAMGRRLGDILAGTTVAPAK